MKRTKFHLLNLKHVLVEFLQHMFGDVDVRFRPSFFPFTEPSAELIFHVFSVKVMVVEFVHKQDGLKF